MVASRKLRVAISLGGWQSTVITVREVRMPVSGSPGEPPGKLHEEGAWAADLEWSRESEVGRPYLSCPRLGS